MRALTANSRCGAKMHRSVGQPYKHCSRHSVPVKHNSFSWQPWWLTSHTAHLDRSIAATTHATAPSSSSAAAAAGVQFDGGKMLHIFKLVDNPYIDEYENEQAETALQHGTFYIKVDGSYHMVVKPADGGPVTMYARYDVKAGAMPADSMPLPGGRNAGTYTSKEQKHTYVYRPVGGVHTQGKLQKVYDHLARAAAQYLADKPPGSYSIEVVGRKFKKTPGVDADAAIALHSQQSLDPAVAGRLKDYASVKAYLLEEACMEGIVIEHEGMFWKVRSNCFDKQCTFEQLRRGKCEMPPTYKPPVLMPGSAYPPRSS